MIFSPAFLTTTKLFARWLVDKIIQMIPSAFEDFREVWPCCEDTKRQICTTSSHHALLVGGEDTIPADAKHFDDYVHFTDAGNEAMARRVTTALISSSAFRALVLDTIAVKPASASPL